MSSESLRRGFLILMCIGLNEIGAAAEPLNDYKRALVEYYGAVYYHPLLLPEGHRVGDVIDIRTLAVLREQEDCFPGLQTEEHYNLSLPRIMLLENQEDSIWVKLKYLLRLEIKADDTLQVLMNLEDMSVESATLGALQDSLNDRCPELSTIFEKNRRMVRIMGRRASVISGILKGRVNTVFSYSGGTTAEIRLEDLAKLLGANQLKHLSPELAATYGLSERVNIIAEANGIQTVAYRPATIYRPELGSGTEGEIDVEPFDSENADHQERLRNLANAWAELEE